MYGALRDLNISPSLPTLTASLKNFSTSFFSDVILLFDKTTSLSREVVVSVFPRAIVDSYVDVFHGAGLTAAQHEDVIRKMLEVLPEKIIYVSCNPATQARDMAILSEKYFTEKIQPVDMFPHTAHVESVAKLVRK